MNHCLILIARYNPLFVKQELFPEIEKYCTEFGILSQTAYDIFQKINLQKIAYTFIIYMRRQIYQSTRNMRRLHLVRILGYSQTRFKDVILRFCVFLQLFIHVHQTMRCEDIMNSV